MKKKNTFIRVLALSLCAIVLCLSFVSCTAGDKIKTGASDAWEKVKDGAEDIYNSVTDKSTSDIELDPISSAHIRLASLETSTASAGASYKTILKASDFAGCASYTNAAGATYVMHEQRVGGITAVTGAEQADYWTATAGDKPIVAVDGNMSRVCVVLPSGFTDVATWAAAANDFSVTVSPVMVKELVATVLPGSATNKAVEWSVSVETKPDGVEIDPMDYIRILTFEGLWENRVQVLALAPFPGIEFKITCTTVVGGYTADCIVKYVGEPSELNLYTENTDGSRNYISEKTTFKAGNTYQIKFALDNVFGVVGDKYNQYEIAEYGVEGKISVLAGEYYWQQGRWTNWENKDIELTEYLSDFIKNATITEDGSLTLELGIAVTEFDDGSITGGVEYYYRTFYKTGAENITFWVKVRESNSGKYNILRFTIEPVVESVSLSNSALTF